MYQQGFIISTMVDIISLNCQGLGDYKKRKDVFQYLRRLNSNIYCLQDTHFIIDLEDQIRSEWGYTCAFSSFRSNARGVCILFNNNFGFDIGRIITDENGNYLIIELKIDNKDILLCNLYGPNNDDPDFYDSLFTQVTNQDIEYVIFCGDFNLVQNPTLDYCNYVNINNINARQCVLDFKEETFLVDPFRELHETKKKGSHGGNEIHLNKPG